MNINRVKLQHDRELIMFRFYFPLFVVLLSDIYEQHFEYFYVQYVRLKTTCEAIKLRRKRLLTISKINIAHKLQKPCRFKRAPRCLLQDEPRGKNVTQSFLFTAKSITKCIVFFGTFSL